MFLKPLKFIFLTEQVSFASCFRETKTDWYPSTDENKGVIFENHADKVSFHYLSLGLYRVCSGYHLLLYLLSMLSSPSQFNAFSCERHLFYNFLSLSFFNFPPSKPSLPSPSFSSPSLSHTLSRQGHKLLKEKKKIIWILWITLLFLSSCSCPPSYSQRYLSADFPHACQGWTALGNSR